MKRILVTGAGGSAASNFVASLRMAPEPFYIIGADVRPYHLALSDAEERYLLPRAGAENFIPEVNRLIEQRAIEMVHAQPDPEVAVLSAHRNEIHARLFLPTGDVIEHCQDKLALIRVLQNNKVPVAQSFPVYSADDLPDILQTLLRRADRVWLRAMRGAGSRAALPVRQLGQARAWIEYWAEMRGVGWGDFMASEFLPGREFAFSGLWHNGKLVTSQARERIEYLYGQLTASGQTSTPSIARTVSREDVNDIATRAVLAVDAAPNGIYSVDLKENSQGVPCVTEINAGRFFTTSNFFATAGLNIPYYYTLLAFGEPVPPLPRYNALEEGLYWVRMVDMGFKVVREDEWASALSDNDQDELRAYYEHKAESLNELALTYENPNLYKRFFYHARSDAILRALAPLRADSWVLDVGAGSGYHGQQIAAAGANAVLVDISQTVLEQARAGGANAIGYICCDAANLPFAPQAFDKILCTEVLEHLPDAPQALAETARVLKREGELVVTTPSRWSPMNLAYGIKRRVRGYAFNEHLTEYTILGFNQLLAQSFSIVSFAYANFLVPYPFDQFFMDAQSPRLIRILQWLEHTMVHTPILQQLGWTMIATCRKRNS